MFKPLSNVHVDDTADYIIKKAILTNSANNMTSNNLLAYECTDIVIFYECSFCHGNDPDCPSGGTWYEYYRFCDWMYYPDPDTGGGGGGGGTGGGGTPPNCNPPAVPFAKGTNGQNNIVPDCEGGWEPLPDEPFPTTLDQKKNFLVQLLSLNHAQQSTLLLTEGGINTLFDYLFLENNLARRNIAIWAIEYFANQPSVNMVKFKN